MKLSDLIKKGSLKTLATLATLALAESENDISKNSTSIIKPPKPNYYYFSRDSKDQGYIPLANAKSANFAKDQKCKAFPTGVDVPFDWCLRNRGGWCGACRTANITQT